MSFPSVLLATILLLSAALVPKIESSILNAVRVHPTTDQSSKYVIITDYSIHFVPDFDTLEMLDLHHNISAERYIPSPTSSCGLSDTSMCTKKRHHNHIPKLSKAGSSNPYIQLEYLLQMATIFSKPIQWHSITHFTHMMNPSIVYWHGRYLMAWRTGRYESDLRFQFLNYVKNENSDNKMAAVLDKNSSFLEMTRVPSLGLQETRDDPRLIVLPCSEHNNNNNNQNLVSRHEQQTCKLLVLYAIYHPKRYGIARQVVTEATFQPSTHAVTFSPAVQLETQPLLEGISSKNWMPFVYENETFLIINIFPWHIAKYPHDLMDKRQTSNANSHTHILENLIPPTIHNSATNSDNIHYQNINNKNYVKWQLPWNPSYGHELRGGTPALRISSTLYLSFFHTSTLIQGRRAYFMGGLTFCAPSKSSSSSLSSTSFYIHSMHAYPIFRDKFYGGKLVNKEVMYVVFPMGLTWDVGKDNNGNTENNSKNEFVLLSFGHNDKDGYTVRLNVTEVVESMQLVQSCV